MGYKPVLPEDSLFGIIAPGFEDKDLVDAVILFLGW